MLDDVLGWSDEAPLHNKVILIKDSVSSPGSFLVLHLLKKALASVDPLVIFVGLKEPFSHYSKIARKQGCDLAQHRDCGTLVYIDLLSKSNFDLSSLSSSGGVASVKNKLFPLFESFVKILRQAPRRNMWIIIDDWSLLEVVAEGNIAHLLDFLHYCRTFASKKQACSLILLTHRDVYERTEESAMAHYLEFLSDILINVEPLATGQASDVHGQVIVEHKIDSRCVNQDINGYGLHYKLMENNTLFFTPGKHV